MPPAFSTDDDVAAGIDAESTQGDPIYRCDFVCAQTDMSRSRRSSRSRTMGRPFNDYTVLISRRGAAAEFIDDVGAIEAVGKNEDSSRQKLCGGVAPQTNGLALAVDQHARERLRVGF